MKGAREVELLRAPPLRSGLEAWKEGLELLSPADEESMDVTALRHASPVLRVSHCRTLERVPLHHGHVSEVPAEDPRRTHASETPPEDDCAGVFHFGFPSRGRP
jgi:hypothetical protein